MLTRDAVRELMKIQRGSMCPRCVSARLGIPLIRIVAVVMDIERRDEQLVHPGVCGECDVHQRHVLWPLAGAHVR